MAKARTYPPANRTAQWWEDDFSRARMARVMKLLLHTTETADWPGYEAGAKAPNITYHPWKPAGQRWRQHNYLDTSSRALQDPTSTAVRENRDDVVQVEIICYCDPKSYAKYGHGVNALPDHAYEDLGAFLAFLHLEWGAPIQRAPKWSTFPPPDSIRMSGPEYDAFAGVLGHQHASGNTHGDPGMTNAQVDRILAVARRIVAASGGTPIPPAEDDMAGEGPAILAELRKLAVGEAGRYQRYEQIHTATLAALQALSAALMARLTAEDLADDADLKARFDALNKSIEDLKATAPAEPPVPKA